MRTRSLALAALPLLVLTGCPKAPSTTTPQQTTSPAVATSPLFRDVAEEAGVRYTWSPLGNRPLNILQTIGNGCAFLDFDNDNNLDILLVGQKPALFKGDGKGHFTDVSQATLGSLKGYFLGCAVADYDNDGFQDIYLSGYREARLLHNDAGKRFVDVTTAAGLKPQQWGTSAAFADLDGDGYLDLFVGNYADFGPNTKPQLCRFKTPQHGDLMSSCGPTYYTGIPGVAYRNRGGKSFEDVTQAWGFTKQNGRTLGVAIVDFDGSGRPSVALANDEAPGDLFVNEGPGKFTNQAEIAGTALDRDGQKHGGMGTDWGDYDNDGKFDLAVATFRREVKNLYHNDGGMIFTDQSPNLGIGTAAQPYVAFGLKFLDADNDGWLDLLIANGHVQDNIELIENDTYRQPLQLFQSQQGKSFTEATKEALPGIKPIVGRGLAVGDYDNDGKIDALVVDSEGKPLLLHNETKTPAHWITLKLVATKGNKDAIGATLIATLPDGKKILRHCHTDGSYMSASDKRVHIGLSTATTIQLTVKWPDGTTQEFKDLSVDRIATLTQGNPGPQ